MDTVIKISAKMLGELAMEDCCPRCFWLRLRCRTLPYQRFPGLMMILDSYIKQIVLEHYERFHRLPKWLTGIGDLDQPLPVPHHSKFYVIDKETNIRLSGVPDSLFKCRDGSYCILDYKTARWSESQEALVPLYSVQVQVYAWIAEHAGFAPVSKVGLVYLEMQRLADLSGEFESVLMNDGFHVQFCARYLDIKPDPQAVLPPLLKRVRQLADMAEPPLPTTGCKDCQAVSELLTRLSPPK
jgi:hypothetical protein